MERLSSVVRTAISSHGAHQLEAANLGTFFAAPLRREDSGSNNSSQAQENAVLTV